MASKLILVVLLVFVSLSLTSGYSLSTRDAISEQDDKKYVMDQESSTMVFVEDVVKGRILARVARSKVVVNKAVSKNSPSKSPKKKHKSSKKKHKSKKIGSLDVGALVGIIIAAIVVTIVIICVIYCLYLRHKTKKAQSTEQETATEKINDSSKTQTSKTEDV